MNINELENRTGITKQNIRFYEKKGLLHPSRNEVNNYREYTEDDFRTLQTIKILRKLDFSIEDIRNIFSEETSFNVSLKRHLKTLEEKQQELDACIVVCRELLGCDIKSLDINGTLRKMDIMERNGGKFMSIIQDYRKFAVSESKKRFSFKPDTMVRSTAEFTEALLQYASENDLNLVIKRPGMSPVFEIDGLEYTAVRTFDRFGATINCSLTHPEDVEEDNIPKMRRLLYRFLRSPFFIVVLILVYLAVSRQSLWAALMVGAVILPYLFWMFPRLK